MAGGTRLAYLQLNIPQKIWPVHLFAFVNYDLFNNISRTTQEFVRNVDTWASAQTSWMIIWIFHKTLNTGKHNKVRDILLQKHWAYRDGSVDKVGAIASMSTCLVHRTKYKVRHDGVCLQSQIWGGRDRQILGTHWPTILTWYSVRFPQGQCTEAVIQRFPGQPELAMCKSFLGVTVFESLKGSWGQLRLSIVRQGWRESGRGHWWECSSNCSGDTIILQITLLLGGHQGQ